MASLDVRDVLNLPAEGTARPRKSKPVAPRPNLKGLAREVQSLGGGNPIAIVPVATSFKKRRIGHRKPAAKWKLASFTNTAREGDPSLALHHWKRMTEPGAPPDQAAASGDDEADDSAFAKFNVQVQVPQYSEDQYISNLQHPDWTKDETDYLLQLALNFDLRWPLIWDRYDYRPPNSEAEGDSMAIVPAARSERDIDALKARYYEVAAKMMAAQTPVTYMPPQQQHLHNMMANYNPERERARRRFAVETLSRSKDEAKEEESLLLELKRILARSEQLNEQRRDLYARLDYPASEGDQGNFKGSACLQQLLSNLVNMDKTRPRKRALENGTSPGAQTPVAESAGGSHNRRDSTVSGYGRRDSVSVDHGAPTPTSARAPPKKGSISAQAAAVAAQQERRRLTEIEEVCYGVSHHDRLTGGATFRYEKINKLFSHKSGQQQQRITNVLTELGIPPRLQMPTSAVVSKFEGLIGAVNALLDSRKLSDKMEAELKTEMAKRQHRLELEERARKAAAAAEEASEAEGEGEGGVDAAGGSDGVGAEAEKVRGKVDRDGGAVPTNEYGRTAQTNGDGGSGDGQDAQDAADPVLPPAPLREEAALKPSSSSHKRSASAMSAVDDDKAVKRQKK